MFKDGAELTQDAARGDEYAQAKLKAAPQLEQHLFWEAFWDLSTMRVSGMSLGPIPLDKIHWYADAELGLDEDEKRAFVYIIRRLDSHFIGKLAEKNKQDTK